MGGGEMSVNPKAVCKSCMKCSIATEDIGHQPYTCLAPPEWKIFEPDIIDVHTCGMGVWEVRIKAWDEESFLERRQWHEIYESSEIVERGEG